MNEKRILAVASLVETLARESEQEVENDAKPFMTDMLMGLCLAWNQLTDDPQMLLPFTHTLNHLAVEHLLKEKAKE
jgi:hypothetical protein